VKLFHQENEIVASLRRLELGAEEMHVLRECATKFRSNAYASKPSSVLPLSLAGYVFECLCGGANNGVAAVATTTTATGLGDKSQQLANNGRVASKEDDQLGFDAAVAALSLKV